MKEKEKSNHHNYATWTQDLKTLLPDKNYWSFIVGKADAKPKQKRYYDP